MSEKSDVITVHYSEIALKGKNKWEFERALVNNIKNLLCNEQYDSISKKSTRFILRLNDRSNTDSIVSKLKKVFGIKWFAVAFSIQRDIDILGKFIISISKVIEGRTIEVDTKRADKSFPLGSMDVNRIIGAELTKIGFKVDLRNPEAKIFIEILKDEILVSLDKLSGAGGLPVGTSGKVLCLLSGGIDSPAAAWLMMKRGCKVDFLHVASDAEFENIEKSKIVQLIKQLKEYSPSKCKFYLAPYAEFYKTTFGLLPSDARNELVLFKRFLLLLAHKICTKNGYFGIVSGDSVAQVASQTLENIYTTNAVTNLPVYRPLAGYDKEEIIDLAKKIRTFDISTQEYKDCCSLVAMKHPATKTKLRDVERLEEEINIEKIVEKTLATMKGIEF